LTALERQDEELTAVLVSVRKKGERAAVRRPARREVAVFSTGERPGLARAVELYEHEARAIPRVVVGINPRDDVGNLRAVRAELWVADKPQPIHVFGRNGATLSPASSHWTRVR